MHYLCFKGWFRYYYLYVDAKNYLADSLFYKREIPVRFLETYEAYNKDEDEYWIDLQNCSNAGVYCSECHVKVFPYYPMKKKLSLFCPHCGAKMDGETVKY